MEDNSDLINENSNEDDVSFKKGSIDPNDERNKNNSLISRK